MIALNKTYIDKIVQDALNEDIGSGDITTIITVPADATATANFVAKATGIVAGIDIANEIRFFILHIWVTDIPHAIIIDI